MSAEDVSVSGSNVPLAIGLTIAAGLSTCIGAILPFFVKVNDVRFLAFSLAFAAGVMTYVSFVEIVQKSLEEFGNVEGLGMPPDVATTLTFFSGLILTGGIVSLVHSIDPLSHLTQKIGGAAAAAAAHHHHENADPSSESNGSPSTTLTVAQASDIETARTSTEVAVPPLPSTTTTPSTLASEKESKSNTKEILVDEKQAREKVLMRLSLISALAISLHNFPEGLATFVSALASPSLGVPVAVAIAIHNIP
ncbi:hypothetical protein HK102_004275, partial [Quaeritorhiza haematococci]